MRFLHLADLHIGKRVNEFSMIEDQKYILTEILRIIDENKIEAVMIAGDVYDKAVPAAEAVSLLDYFLNGLAQRKLKVFVISGNHDSAERIGFGSALMEKSGVYMAKPYSGKMECVSVEDAYGMVHVYMLPFIKPAIVKQYFPEQIIESYDDALRLVMENTEIDIHQRNIIVAHQLVMGGTRCDSEDVSIGGIDQVSADNFSKFDYTALGHLHSPQSINSECIRYAGTPLKYSFSEINHEKCAIIVDIKEKGNIDISSIPLNPMRDMKEIQGTYMEITDKAFYKDFRTEDYYRIVLKDEEDIPDAIGKLRVIYPNIMRLEYDNRRTRKNNQIGISDNIEKKSPMELFEEFYELQNNQPMSKEQDDFVKGLIESIWEEHHETT